MTPKRKVKSVTDRQFPRKGYERTRTTTNPVGKTKTQQSHQQECDINRIVGKYMQTGLIDHVNSQEPRYGDFSAPQDFHHALNAVRAAQSDFAALPAELRALCDNNTEKFLELLDDPSKQEILEKYGLMEHAGYAARPTSSPSEASPSAPPEKPEEKSTSPTLDTTGTTDTSQLNPTKTEE